MRPTSAKRAVRRLAIARVISIGGGSAAYTALMYRVFELTGSPAWLSATLLLTFGVGGLVAPVGGVLGDRYDRRAVMIVSDLLGAACFTGMALVTADARWLLGLAFASAIVEAPFWSASGAAIPNLVALEDLSWANGLLSLGRNAGIMLGPAAGGLLVASIGAGWVFVLNALTFAVSAALVATVRGRFAGERDGAREHRGVRAGFAFIARDPVLRTMVLAWVVLVLGMGMVMVADVPLVKVFDAGPVGYGLLIACWGAGSVLGSLAGRWLDEQREPRALLLGTLLVGLTTAAIAVSPWFAPILAMALLSGLGDAVVLVAEQGIQQRRTPDAVRSRVLSASDAVVTVSFAVSLALAGIVLRAVGAQRVYAIGGATALAAAAVLLPVLRRASTPQDARVAESAPDEAAVTLG
ncbi:MAG TPA: MFS transporter [Actinomycetota bacterium]|nr:MFS transporter [Actinomycetota bacterium]